MGPCGSTLSGFYLVSFPHSFLFFADGWARETGNVLLEITISFLLPKLDILRKTRICLVKLGF